MTRIPGAACGGGEVLSEASSGLLHVTSGCRSSSPFAVVRGLISRTQHLQAGLRRATTCAATTRNTRGLAACNTLVRDWSLVLLVDPEHDEQLPEGAEEHHQDGVERVLFDAERGHDESREAGEREEPAQPRPRKKGEQI